MHHKQELRSRNTNHFCESSKKTYSSFHAHVTTRYFPKKDRFVATFFLEIKKTVDNLVVVGCSISTKDHIKPIVDGLSNEYDSFITLVTSRLDPYTVEDIESLLLAQEGRILKRSSIMWIGFFRQIFYSFLISNTNYTHIKPFSLNYTSSNGKQCFSNFNSKNMKFNFKSAKNKEGTSWQDSPSRHTYGSPDWRVRRVGPVWVGEFKRLTRPTFSSLLLILIVV